MTDLDAIRARAANIATGSVYSQQQTAADYTALLAEIDRRTTDLIAEQSVRQDEWDHASELLKDDVKSVSHWEQQTVSARAERDRYRLAWLSARKRAAELESDMRHYEETVIGDLNERNTRDCRRAARAEQERDGAYRERAQLVALLAAIYPAVLAPAPDVDEHGWQILYLDLPSGQASWHIHPRDTDLYGHVQQVPAGDPRARWDGHTTEQKYARIAQHAADQAKQCGRECSEAHTYTGRCQGRRNVLPAHACSCGRIPDPGVCPVQHSVQLPAGGHCACACNKETT